MSDQQEKERYSVRLTGAAALLVILGGAVLFAQGQNTGKYSLRSPGGIAFSDFRGYEDWPVVSSARTDEVLKVIVANPAMIQAYKIGIPGNGHAFPEGNYDAASDKFTADLNSPADCGNSCHVAVKAKDYIFHPYQKR